MTYPEPGMNITSVQALLLFEVELDVSHSNSSCPLFYPIFVVSQWLM